MAPTVTDAKTTVITAAYSNSTSDMQAEYDLYTKADTIVQLLSSWSSNRDSMHGQMEQLWNNLCERSFIKLEDVELAQLWLQELTASTYRFPCVDATATTGTTTTAATLSNSSVDANSAIDKSLSADVSTVKHSDATTATAAVNVTRLKVTGIPPLQGWSIGGGHAVTVPLTFSNASAVTAGARTALSNAELCADQCAVHVNCTAWRYGPQKAPDTDFATAAYDVQCDAKGNGRKRKCRCVLHMPIPAAVAAAAMADVNRTALQEQHRIIGIRPRAADNAITYSGVVQRDTVVYTGKPPSSSQPLKILVVINFHWHISKGTHIFLLQKVLPLCLPAGFSIVVIGPHADNDVKGVLLNPWTYKGHFSGLSLALAHAKFPDYDGYLLQNDDFMMDYWNMDLKKLFGRQKLWGTFSMNPAERSEKDLRTVAHNMANKKAWFWWKMYFASTKAALTALHSSKYAHLIAPDSHLAQYSDGYVSGRADGYYVPERYMRVYSDILQLFTEQHVFLEIAVPTAIGHMISAADYIKVQLCQPNGNKKQRAKAKWQPTCTTAHPLKFSKGPVKKQAVDVFNKYCKAHKNSALKPHVYP
eukprot:19250-Heterococcus_DN1.PRE.3